LFGRWLHASGLSRPLVVLGFAGTWGFPILSAVVAGDIFSTEDHQGTWRTLLTRSADRASMFAGKALAAATWSVGMTILIAVAATVAGVAVLGRSPLILLDGSAHGSAFVLRVVVEAWLVALPPMLGFTALALAFSVVARNSVVGVLGPVVLGLLMELLDIIVGNGPVRGLLLTTPFDAWHGLARSTAYGADVVHGLGTCAVWIICSIWVAHRTFLNRDMAA
jgi:ABC-2 type transport system permease protein